MVNAKAGAAISGSVGGRHHLAPIPRQEFSQISDLMIGDPGQHVSEPGLRIDAVELGRLCRPPNYAERQRFSPLSIEM